VSGYTKLFSSIVTSTIWREDCPTKVVWVTMMALSDKDGIVEGSIPGLAHIAGVTLDECKRALDKLQSPDEYSRTPENEGRRIEPISGGWLILNRTKYRDSNWEEDRAERHREATRKWRDRKRSNGDSGDNHQSQCDSARYKTETETEKTNHADLSQEAWFVARGVSTNLRLAGQDILSILHDQAEFELQDGGTAEEVGNRMIAAWKGYEKVKAEAKFGVKNFFATGEWRKTHKPARTSDVPLGRAKWEGLN
jgi:hypothetical protein